MRERTCSRTLQYIKNLKHIKQCDIQYILNTTIHILPWIQQRNGAAVLQRNPTG